MKVVYDISLIGQASGTPAGRTGINRVADNVVRALSHREDFELSLCAASLPRTTVDCLGYVRVLPELNKLPFLATPLAQSPLFRRLLSMNQAAPSRPLSLSIRGLEMIARPFSTGANTDIDIYHSPGTPFPRRMPKGRSGRPIIRFLTVYDVIPLIHPQWFMPDTVKRTQRLLGSLRPEDWAITISESTKADLCRLVPRVESSHVAAVPLAASELFRPCGDAAAKESVRGRCGIPPEVPYVLSLNTLEPRKNVVHLIRCFARVAREPAARDLRLVLAGGKGWKFDNILDAALSADIQDRVIFAGFVADDDLSALYSGAVMFVYPSLYEGFGLPPLEAMQCGVPVITSNVSSLPEVVGDAGFMVPPADGDVLCQKMLDLLNDASLRSRFSSQSIQRAAEFSWARNAQMTVNTYRAAMVSS